MSYKLFFLFILLIIISCTIIPKKKKIENFVKSHCYLVKTGDQYLNLQRINDKSEIYLDYKPNDISNKKHKLFFNLVGNKNGNELYTISSNDKIPIYLKANCSETISASPTNNSTDNYWIINEYKGGISIESYKYPSKYLNKKSEARGYLFRKKGKVHLSTKKSSWTLLPCQKITSTMKSFSLIPSTTLMPMMTTEAPMMTTEAPMMTTEAPIMTTEAPMMTTEVPMMTTEAPMMTTGAQMKTTTTTLQPTILRPTSMQPTTTTTTLQPTTLQPTTLQPTTSTTTLRPTTLQPTTTTTTLQPTILQPTTTTTTLQPTTTTTTTTTTTAKPSININWVSSEKLNNNYTKYLLKGILGKISGGWDEQVIKNINGADTFFQDVKKGDELYLVRWSVYNPQNQSLSISPPCGLYYLNKATQVCYYGGWSYADPNMTKRFGNGGLIMTTQYNPPPKLPIVEPVFDQSGKINSLKLKDTSDVWAMGNIPARLGYNKIDSTSSVVPDMPDYSIQPKNYTGGLYIALVKKKPNYSGLAYNGIPRIYGNKIQEGKDYVILPLPTPSQFGKSLSMPSSCQAAKNTQSNINVSVDSNGTLSGCWVYPATKYPTPGNSVWVTNMGDGKEYPISRAVKSTKSIRQGSGATVIVGPVSPLDSNYPSYVEIKNGGTGYCVDTNTNVISVNGSYLEIEPTTANIASCNALKAKYATERAKSEGNKDFFEKKCLPYGLNGVYYFKNGSNTCTSGSSNVQCDKQPFDATPATKYEDQYWQPLDGNTKTKTQADYANFYQNDLDKCIDAYKNLSPNMKNYPSFKNKSSFKPPVKENVKCPVTVADSPIGPCRLRQSYFDIVASPPHNTYNSNKYACVRAQESGNNPKKLCYNLKRGVKQGKKVRPNGIVFDAFDFTKAGGPPCTCPCPSGYQSYCGSHALKGNIGSTIPDYVPPLTDQDYWWGDGFYIQNNQVNFKCWCGKTPSQDENSKNTLEKLRGRHNFKMNQYLGSIYKPNYNWSAAEIVNLIRWAGINLNNGENNLYNQGQRIAIIALFYFVEILQNNGAGGWEIYQIVEQYLPIETFKNDYRYWGAYAYGKKFPDPISPEPASKAAIEKILKHYNLDKSKFFGSNPDGLQYIKDGNTTKLIQSTSGMYSDAK